MPGRLRRQKLRAAQSLDALIDEGFGPLPPQTAPTRHWKRRSAWRFCARAIAWLPEEQRLAFTLVVLEELPYEEAAARLGVATGTVKAA